MVIDVLSFFVSFYFWPFNATSALQMFPYNTLTLNAAIYNQLRKLNALQTLKRRVTSWNASPNQCIALCQLCVMHKAEVSEHCSEAKNQTTD